MKLYRARKEYEKLLVKKEFQKVPFSVMLKNTGITQTAQWFRTVHTINFSGEQELTLVKYLKNSSTMLHGVTPNQTRQLAYGLAERYKLDMLLKWRDNRLAGKDWLNGFLKQNPSLSIRRPEETSLVRTTAFNQHTVTVF